MSTNLDAFPTMSRVLLDVTARLESLDAEPRQRVIRALIALYEVPLPCPRGCPIADEPENGAIND